MDLYILNASFAPVGIIDSASSVIWSDRFYDVGDFEVYIKASAKNIELFQAGYFIRRPGSSMVGIIEQIKISTDVENGDYLTLSGRDLKSLLDRRIIWSQTILSGYTEMILRRLLLDNLISPAIAARQMPGVILGAIHGYTDVTELQSMGDSLLTKVIELCKASEIGWKVTLNSSNQIVIDFYKGVNRSYSQSVNPYVVFSPEFDNLLTTETITDAATLKNVALVAGEGQGNAQITATSGTSSGMGRRELFVSASDISSNNGEISSSAYLQLLQERGNEQLAAAVETFTISGTAETALTYELNVDYSLGDIVAVANEYGVKANTRVIEIIECEDESGKSIIPTFEEWRTV